MSDDGSWRDMIVRDRMAVDREFGERVRQSAFSSQEWNLIMTAVEFEVRGSGEDARLVADTDRVESVMPELERVGDRPASRGSGGDPGGGIVDSIRSALGFGGGDDRLEEAVDLADAYAAALQAHLEEEGKWERVRDAAD